jgi:hypothetical protein
MINTKVSEEVAVALAHPDNCPDKTSTGRLVMPGVIYCENHEVCNEHCSYKSVIE